MHPICLIGKRKRRLLLVAVVTILYSFLKIEKALQLYMFAPQSVAFDEKQFLTPVSYKSACLQSYCLNDHLSSENNTDRLTIVSAYFNLGTFQKGDSEAFSSDLYLSWVSTYRLLLSDVIIFSDDPRFLEAFQHARNSTTQKTCFCLVQREALWSFRMVPIMNQILNQPYYPKYSPNTVLPEYAAAMHSKYAVMQLALEWNPFDAKNFGWADVGIFRLLSKLPYEPPFHLNLPATFDPKRVAFSQIEPPNFQLPIVEFFRHNMVWVAGGFFVAESTVMARWIEQYRSATILLLQMGLSDTDQQVIYSMYTPFMREKLTKNSNSLLHIQSYEVQLSDRIDNWFYLPFRSRLDWFKNGCQKAQCVHVTVRMQDCDKPSFIGWIISIFLL